MVHPGDPAGYQPHLTWRDVISNLKLLRDQEHDKLIHKYVTVDPRSRLRSLTKNFLAVMDVSARLEECLVLIGTVGKYFGSVSRTSSRMIWSG